MVNETIEADLPDQISDKKPEKEEAVVTKPVQLIPEQTSYKKTEVVSASKPAQVSEPVQKPAGLPEEVWTDTAIALDYNTTIMKRENLLGTHFDYKLNFKDTGDQGTASMYLSRLSNHESEKELSMIFKDSGLIPEDHVAHASLEKYMSTNAMPTLLTLLETDARNNHARAIYFKTSDAHVRSFLEKHNFESLMLDDNTIGLYKILEQPTCPEHIDPNVIEQIYEKNPKRAKELLLESGLTEPQACLQMGEQYQEDGNYTKAAFYFVIARTWDKAKACWTMQAENEIKAKNYQSAAFHFKLAGDAVQAKLCSDMTAGTYS
jgi:hypothetical protein